MKFIFALLLTLLLVAIIPAGLIEWLTMGTIPAFRVFIQPLYYRCVRSFYRVGETGGARGPIRIIIFIIILFFSTIKMLFVVVWAALRGLARLLSAFSRIANSSANAIPEGLVPTGQFTSMGEPASGEFYYDGEEGGSSEPANNAAVTST